MARILLLACLLLASSATVCATRSLYAADDGYRTVALYDPTDLSEGSIRSITGGSINDLGQVALRARVDGDSTIFSEGGGNGLETIAIADSEVSLSGAPTRLGRFFNVPNINNQGQVAFAAQLSGVLSDDILVKQGSTGALELVAQEGSDIGSSGIRLESLSIVTPLFNDLGQIAAEGRLFSPSSSGIGSFSEGRGSTIEVLTIPGGDAFGQADGITFSAILDLAAMNDWGRSVLIAGLAGVDTPSGLSQALFTHGAGNGLEIIEESGNPVDAIGPGVSLGNFLAATINNSDDIAFSNLLSGSGINSANNSGLFRRQNGGDLELIAREGDLAPGTTDETRFLSIAGGPGSILMNSQSNIAFLANLTGPAVTNANDRAIFLSTPEDGLQLIAREGQIAPGLEDGSTLTSLGAFAFNDRNQVAITSFLPPSAAVISGRTGLWATDLRGDLQLIAAEGTLIDVSDDPSSPDLRMVEAATINSTSGSGDGKARHFNNEGQLLIQADFVGTTGGFFVSDAVATPLLPGDFNQNGSVDSQDLELWRDDYGEIGQSLVTDANENGSVDGADFLIWQNSAGATSGGAAGSSATVPEPTCLTALLFFITPASEVWRRSVKRSLH